MKRVRVKKYIAATDTLLNYDLNVNFDPDEVSKNLTSTQLLTSNDKHSSHLVEGMMKIDGIMYVTENPDIKETPSLKMKIVTETFEDYEKKMEELPESNYRWMYNILDGDAERDNILYRDGDFVLMTDYTWDKRYISQLHMLVIVTDRALRSIRDIRKKHIPKLRSIVKDSLVKIKETYSLNEDRVKIFFHYPPSTYLLHIHLVHVERCDDKTSFEKCVEFFSFCKNVEMDETYYQGDLPIIDHS